MIRYTAIIVMLACLTATPATFGMFHLCRPRRSSAKSQTPPHITTVNVTQRDRQGNTILHRVSNTHRAQRFIALGADPNARNHRNQTPLHTIANARIAGVLIQADTNINAVDI